MEKASADPSACISKVKHRSRVGVESRPKQQRLNGPGVDAVVVPARGTEAMLTLAEVHEAVPVLKDMSKRWKGGKRQLDKQAEAEKLNVEISKVEEHLNDVEAEKDKLKVEVKDLQTKAGADSELTMEIARLKNALREVEGGNQDLKKEIAKLKQRACNKQLWKMRGPTWPKKWESSAQQFIASNDKRKKTKDNSSTTKRFGFGAYSYDGSRDEEQGVSTAAGVKYVSTSSQKTTKGEPTVRLKRRLVPTPREYQPAVDEPVVAEPVVVEPVVAEPAVGEPTITKAIEDDYGEYFIQHIKSADKYDQPSWETHAYCHQVIGSSRRCTQLVIPLTTSTVMMSHLTLETTDTRTFCNINSINCRCLTASSISPVKTVNHLNKHALNAV
ncbi:unnamed protein product [Phytophthora lilii]|uniref:Unnamed protein product n=1 Tax=Phytophthora lilii TaxID=2077276 RepID=A0A9W6X1R9_9STRA|nr:unnamed protein product [Phytophthora lilii]